MGWLFILGSGSDYTHASRHVVTLLEAVWKGKRTPIKRYINAPIYIIQTDDPGHWTSPPDFFNTLSQYLNDAGIPFTKLGTYDDIWNTLWSDPPPENIIIINTHGEGQPIPPQYGLIYDTSTDSFTSDYKTVAYNYYKDLGTRIRDYGWLVIEPIGYTFFNAMQYGHDTAEAGALGEAGLNNCLSVIGLSTNCWSHPIQEAKPCCALLYLWNPSWGSISVSGVRYPKPVGNFSYWQFGRKKRWLDYCAGAIAFGEREGLRLFV